MGTLPERRGVRFDSAITAAITPRLWRYSWPVRDPRIDLRDRLAHHALEPFGACHLAPQLLVGDEGPDRISRREVTMRDSWIHHTVLIRRGQLAVVPAAQEAREKRGQDGGRIRIDVAREA